MDIQTENLTILFVDIAGFTATTSRQSRAENATLLDTFNRTLLPLIERYRGHVVKSIGDALLVTLRSPTDAMLCSMAMQDAMHEHNLRVPESARIHIRVAANLGEVRVTGQDIFGEPVNLASRIESVTPADEIYLSEAVYMAMNKAEVPAEEVGFKELAGISRPIRLYSIPRFRTPRLVPERPELAEPEASELLYPHGGMHHRTPAPKLAARPAPMATDESAHRRYLVYALPIAVGAGVALAAFLVMRQPMGELPTAARTPEPAVVAAAPAAPAAAEPRLETPGPAAVPASNEPAYEIVQPRVLAAAPAPTPAKPAPAAAKPAAPAPWTVRRAKEAYRAKSISRDEYERIIERLEQDYEQKIRALKLAYRARQISEETYEQQVREAKIAFKG